MPNPILGIVVQSVLPQCIQHGYSSSFTCQGAQKQLADSFTDVSSRACDLAQARSWQRGCSRALQKSDCAYSRNLPSQGHRPSHSAWKRFRFSILPPSALPASRRRRPITGRGSAKIGPRQTPERQSWRIFVQSFPKRFEICAAHLPEITRSRIHRLCQSLPQRANVCRSHRPPCGQDLLTPILPRKPPAGRILAVSRCFLVSLNPVCCLTLAREGRDPHLFHAYRPSQRLKLPFAAIGRSHMR